MIKHRTRFFLFCCITGISLLTLSIFSDTSVASSLEISNFRPIAQGVLTPTPVFRYPVVPTATISSFFDHSQTQPPPVSGEDFILRFHNGRSSPNSSQGFYFFCTDVGGDGNFWVGCAIPNSGTEASCPNNQEMWYDNHKGVDFEYAANWHTGASCNKSLFPDVFRHIYSPAKGRVVEAGVNPANGRYIRLEHDLNQNGNYSDDQFRSVYLHFDMIAVNQNMIINEGDWLGRGGMTGLAWTPHLHFEVQRSIDNFATRWSVDPYGWQDAGSDPWPNPNYKLWQPSTLYQDIWIGNPGSVQGWSRTVPIVNGTVQWGSASGWSGPTTTSSLGLQGSGDVRTVNAYVFTTYVRQGIWRGAQGWSRTIPIENGFINPSAASGWSGPSAQSSLPGGDVAIQAHTDYIHGNTLRQGVWQNNLGYSRGVPIVNNVIQWNPTPAWSAPVSINTLPTPLPPQTGGDMQAQGSYVLNNKLWQSFWRNNVQYTRSVPIVNGVIQWNDPSAQTWNITTPSLPSGATGPVQAESAYVFP